MSQTELSEVSERVIVVACFLVSIFACFALIDSGYGLIMSVGLSTVVLIILHIIADAFLRLIGLSKIDPLRYVDLFWEVFTFWR